ncbi:MAG TPA: PilW family protein [Burkholderiales bacterium]|nr:PilW family protein [Burkholderiales bacterium]
MGERGFTLVEIMVSLTIGLLLTIAVASLFVNSRRTYATTDDLSRMQENIRYAYHVLNRTIHHAGYKSSPNTFTEDIFTAAAPLISAVDAGAKSTLPDTLTVRFEGNGGVTGSADNTIVDCVGNPVAAAGMVVNTFSIANGANGRPALHCSVNGGAPQELVADVENFQIAFGQDEDFDLVADRFVPFSGAITPLNVRAVRIAMLFSSPNASVNAAPDTKTYDLNEVTIPAANDTRIRRAVTMTISLRNRAP